MRSCAWHPGSCCGGLSSRWERPPIVCGAHGEAGVHRRRRPPPLLRAASMAPEGAPLPSRAQFKEQGEEEGLQVSKCFLLLLSLTDHSSFREGCMSEVGLFWLTVRPLSLWPSAVLMLSTFACLLSPVPVCLFWALYVSLSFCLSVCVACSLVSYSLIHPETGSWFPCLVTACPGLKTGS